MSEQTASPVGAWKKKPEAVTLPSGNRVVVKRSTLKDFLIRGMVPNSLMAIVEQSLSSGQNKATDDEMKKILGDPEKLAELMELMDSVTINCAIEPRVHPAPPREADRDDELLYVDELDEGDKVAIFNYAVGGTVELEPFRGEAEAALGAVQGS
jgi:hypothetical protein